MEILKINHKKLEREKLILIANLLKKGKIIVLPTDTIYGLVCDATNKKAVEKIFKIKKRPKNKSLPIFIKDINTVKKFAYVNKKQEKFLKDSWPGKTTLVLKRKGAKTKIYGVGKKTIAFRIPDLKLIKVLLKKINNPLAETSVNISGYSPAVNIREILDQFKNKKYQPDLIIDSGDLVNKPSTVIDLTVSPLTTLRK